MVMAAPAESRLQLCPSCGKEAIQRSESALKHYLRVATRSPKRFCKACGHRWRLPDEKP